MAPSKSLPASKVALCLSYFRTTAVAHALKDLEKSLPSAAGISSMLVKDYLTHLQNESLISVEKIGSGNWYWSFPADAKLAKERVLAEAKKEHDKVKKAVEEAERAVEDEKGRLGGDEGGRERVQAVERLRRAQERRERLLLEAEGYKGGRVEVGETESLKTEVNAVIDNIYTLEAWVKGICQDPEALEGLRQQVGYEEDMEYLE
ncbi:meiotic nuclear division protein 1 [Geopyxis carbonaria]|nr:meiotic nuclear division protein 1 [Geopyxis carbonaria]